MTTRLSFALVSLALVLLVTACQSGEAVPAVVTSVPASVTPVVTLDRHINFVPADFNDLGTTTESTQLAAKPAEGAALAAGAEEERLGVLNICPKDAKECGVFSNQSLRFANAAQARAYFATRQASSPAPQKAAPPYKTNPTQLEKLQRAGIDFRMVAGVTAEGAYSYQVETVGGRYAGLYHIVVDSGRAPLGHSVMERVLDRFGGCGLAVLPPGAAHHCWLPAPARPDDA